MTKQNQLNKTNEEMDKERERNIEVRRDSRGNGDKDQSKR